jgi:hypothetical protein
VLFYHAIKYYTACMASQLSFVGLFKDLEKYIDDKEKRFDWCVRVKRGMEDTSQPGGYYKDQCYLDGAVQILQDRRNLDFVGLMCGKLSLEDIKKPHVIKKIKRECILIPPFMQDFEQYMLALEIISEVNNIPAV